VDCNDGANRCCLQRVVKRPKNVTANAQKTCCNWLAFCLTLGWKKDSLDALEQMWWDYHDRTGKLVRPHAADEPRGARESHAGASTISGGGIL
jgi:hypothetical protein